MRRGYAAAVDGPITIDIGLFAQDGWIKVQVRPDCPRALIGLSTKADQGPAVAAVRDATVESAPDGRLIASLHGTSTGISTSTGTGTSGAGGPSAAPVEITVLAPPGSTLIARTDTAHIGALGLAEVELRTQSGEISIPLAGRVFAETTSGNVTVQRATDATVTTQSGAISIAMGHRITARTTSGDVLLGAVSGEVTAKSVSGHLTIRDFQGGSIRADTTSGSITLNATANGTAQAGTISGDITITATPTTNLNLRTSTATGQVTAPEYYSRSS